MVAELVIKGGVVVDGTGAPGRRADVAVSGGRVAEVGAGLDGDRVLDASGCVVAPGFIDIHTHYDAQVFWDPALTPSCFHGVTTVVAGNCGFSIAPTRAEHRELIARTLENVEDMDVATLAAGIPWDFETFPQYLGSVAQRGVILNFAAYIGHTALRLYAMGDEAYERTATPDEVVRMQEIIRDAMRSGAAGFATSFAITHRGADGKPIPSRWADRAEVESLLEAVGDVGRGVVSIAPGEQCGARDMYEIQPRIGVPFTWGALLTMPDRRHDLLLEVNRKGWAEGAQVWPQVSPRPLAFAMTLAEPFTLNTNAEFGALMAEDADARRRAYADPAWRDRARAVWAGSPGFSVPRWETYEIQESSAHPDLQDHRLLEIAGERDPLDVLLDLALDEPDLGLRVRAILANDDKGDVARLLVEDHCTFGLSDAGAHVGQLCDAPQATDLLGNWVRERGVMPVEEAVRRLTKVQADLFGLPDRGELRPGAWADVVVFDPETVAPGPLRRVRDFPADSERLTADQPRGVHHVIVNGVPVVADGQVVAGDARPGQVVSPAPREAMAH
jgi:N-acyl-D-aspartate/D-glutamate deacylase